MKLNLKFSPDVQHFGPYFKYIQISKNIYSFPLGKNMTSFPKKVLLIFLCEPKPIVFSFSYFPPFFFPFFFPFSFFYFPFSPFSFPFPFFLLRLVIIFFPKPLISSYFWPILGGGGRQKNIHPCSITLCFISC